MTIQTKISNRIKEHKARIVNKALERRMLRGHSDYQKFIILGRSRTGSNFLASSLRSHSQIVAFGELFNMNHDRILWECPGYERLRASENILSLRESDPIKFFNTVVFRKLQKHILAVGFKIFYYHAQEDNWKCTWPYLKSISNLKIIHIKRKNILRTILSQKIAFQTGKWGIRSERDATENISIRIDYEDCLKTFKTVREQEERYDQFFNSHQKIEVIYEELSTDYFKEAKRIQEFLGAKYEALRPSTKKQSKRPLSKAISNYSELKERFGSTPWLEFFEE